MLRILANDGLDQGAVDQLTAEGMIVDLQHLDEEDLMRFGGNYDVLIVRSATKVTKEVLKACAGKRLSLIIRAGVGLDNIDVEAGKKLGYHVTNTPNASSNSVAELVLGHMFGLARYISISNVTMREGMWNKKQYKGVEIFSKTLGIIGFGRIGRALAKKARALGMNVIFYDSMLQTCEDYTWKPLEELLKEADFISIHTTATDKPLISKAEIGLMKDGAFIINAARGNVIDEEALLEALNEGKIAGAGMDVFCHEPEPNKDLCQHPRVSVTPHIGGSTVEAQKRIGEEVVEIIHDVFKEVPYGLCETI